MLALGLHTRVIVYAIAQFRAQISESRQSVLSGGPEVVEFVALARVRSVGVQRGANSRRGYELVHSELVLCEALCYDGDS